MSDDKNNNTGETENAPQAAPKLPLMIHAQYIKDLSFENPNAPAALGPNQETPKMDIDINIDAAKMENQNAEAFYEVQLTIKVNATRPQGTVFIAELVYGAAVSLNDVPEEKHHPMLLVQTPNYTFPFARNILSDVVQRGGYPPLLLNPVNFKQMYIKRFGDGPATESVDTEEDKKTKS